MIGFVFLALFIVSLVAALALRDQRGFAEDTANAVCLFSFLLMLAAAFN